MPYFTFEDKRIFYIDEGEGNAVLLLPGNTASSAVHSSEIEYFSKNNRVICPDYIGYGKSDRVQALEEDFWIYNAEMCVELMKHLGLSRYAVMGTSGGG